MRRYYGNTDVTPGIYFDPRRMVFKNMEEEGPLPDEGTYYRVPAVLMLPVGAILGVAYVIFLPLVGIGMLLTLVVRNWGRGQTALVGWLRRVRRRRKAARARRAPSDLRRAAVPVEEQENPRAGGA
jgi:hypothetical protein